MTSSSSLVCRLEPKRLTGCRRWRICLKTGDVYKIRKTLIHASVRLRSLPPPFPFPYSDSSPSSSIVGGKNLEVCMATTKRADVVLLARLRAGHTPLRKAYANLLDPSTDPLCPLCKEEPQTIEHWLRRCPRLVVVVVFIAEA